MAGCRSCFPVLVFTGNIHACPSPVEPYFTLHAVQSGGIVEPRAVAFVQKVVMVVSVPHLLELLLHTTAPRSELDHVLWAIIWVWAAVIDSAMSIAAFT